MFLCFDITFYNRRITLPNEKPFVSSCRISHLYQDAPAIQALSRQPEFQVTSFDLRGGGFMAFHFKCPLIPNIHVSCAIVAFGYVTFKFGIFNRMVFYMDRESFLPKLLRRTLRDRPRCQ